MTAVARKSLPSSPARAAEWSTVDKIALANAVLKFGQNEWPNVCKHVMKTAEPDIKRPPDLFTAKACAYQYNALMETFLGPKRKRSDGAGSTDGDQTQAAQILSKLTIVRMEELKRLIVQEHKSYKKMQKEIEAVVSGEVDHMIPSLLADAMREDEANGYDSDSVEQEIGGYSVMSDEELDAEVEKVARYLPQTPTTGEVQPSEELKSPDEAPTEELEVAIQAPQPSPPPPPKPVEVKQEPPVVEVKQEPSPTPVEAQPPTAPVEVPDAAPKETEPEEEKQEEEAVPCEVVEPCTISLVVEEVASLKTESPPELPKIRINLGQQSVETLDTNKKELVPTPPPTVPEQQVTPVRISPRKTKPLTPDVAEPRATRSQSAVQPKLEPMEPPAEKTPSKRTTRSSTKEEEPPLPSPSPVNTPEATPETPQEPEEKRRSRSRRRKEDRNPSEAKLTKKSLERAWRAVADHRHANVFRRPVTDREAPDYSNTVKRPMDLSLLKRQIDAGLTHSSELFNLELLRMFTNAFMFNPVGTPVNQISKEMAAHALDMKVLNPADPLDPSNVEWTRSRRSTRLHIGDATPSSTKKRGLELEEEGGPAEKKRRRN